MANLKPIGSEKLTGQDKINRIMEIARFKEVTPKSINEHATSEYSISLADGNNYQIVRERQGYIIKKTISESNTEYIDPMKNRKYYSSYSQALKRLNLLAGELNRLNENEEGVSLYGEQKKFTLKTPKAPAPEMPAGPPAELPAEPPAVPSPELPPAPSGDMGGEEMPMDDMGGEEMGDEDINVDVDVEDEGGEDQEDQVTFKTIQKLTGKLTQKIRTLDNEEGMTSEDIKYVINMVISALDLNSLSEEDREDIMTKFEEDETEDYGQEDDMDGEDMTDDTEVEDIQTDMDVAAEGFKLEEDFEDSRYSEDYDEDYDPKYKGGYEDESHGNGAIFDSIFGESQVDKVISKYFEVSKSEIREQKERQVQKQVQKRAVVKTIMESVTKMTETIEQELAAERFVKENINSKFIGVTNKKNLVFETKSGQVKITPNGEIL
jgi:PKD repeat protein